MSIGDILFLAASALSIGTAPNLPAGFRSTDRHAPALLSDRSEIDAYSNPLTSQPVNAGSPTVLAGTNLVQVAAEQTRILATRFGPFVWQGLHTTRTARGQYTDAVSIVTKSGARKRLEFDYQITDFSREHGTMFIEKLVENPVESGMGFRMDSLETVLRDGDPTDVLMWLSGCLSDQRPTGNFRISPDGQTRRAITVSGWAASLLIRDLIDDRTNKPVFKPAEAVLRDSKEDQTRIEFVRQWWDREGQRESRAGHLRLKWPRRFE